MRSADRTATDSGRRRVRQPLAPAHIRARATTRAHDRYRPRHLHFSDQVGLECHIERFHLASLLTRIVSYPIPPFVRLKFRTATSKLVISERRVSELNTLVDKD